MFAAWFRNGCVHHAQVVGAFLSRNTQVEIPHIIAQIEIYFAGNYLLCACAPGVLIDAVLRFNPTHDVGWKNCSTSTSSGEDRSTQSASWERCTDCMYAGGQRKDTAVTP